MKRNWIIPTPYDGRVKVRAENRSDAIRWAKKQGLLNESEAKDLLDDDMDMVAPDFDFEI